MYLHRTPIYMRDARQDNSKKEPNFRHDPDRIDAMKEAERKAKIKEIETRATRIMLLCLKELMKLEDLTAHHVSRMTGIDAQTIRNWISGKLQPSRLATSKMKEFLVTFYEKKLASLE